MTINDFWAFLDPLDEHDYHEFIGGFVVKKPLFPMPYAIIHSHICGKLFTFIEHHKLGFYFGRLYYEVSNSLVLVPDATFISKSRINFPFPDKMTHAPDLAIEIIMHDTTDNLIRSKIEAYLTHGTQLVWIVYPEDKVVDVWRAMPDGSLNKRAFGMNDTLSGESVLPNFTLPVHDIFSDEFAS